MGRLGRAWRLLLVFVFVASMCGLANADTQRIAVGPTPIIWVQLETGMLTIHTWDQSAVQIDADSGVQWSHTGAGRFGDRVPNQIMLWSQTLDTPDGPVTLPPEAFVLPPLNGNEHDAVVVRGDGNATVTVPAGAALIVANVNRGQIAVDNYHDGVFVAHVRAGAVTLDGISGTSAVQVVNGRVLARTSDFARVRVRTARGNIIFRHCTARQIEATSIAGSVLFDDGSFQPGLARFESEHGDVAVGVANGGVQIGAHSSAGQIVSGFDEETNVTRTVTDARAIVGGGGPFVTATSGTGTVFFYNGAISQHPQLQERFRRTFRADPAQESQHPAGNAHRRRPSFFPPRIH